MRRVPIFPLPQTVFFPATVLPLHLFEPRYRQMGRGVIEGGGELVVVLLKPGWEQDYAGNPPVHEVATLGTVEDHEELDDGRYNLLLVGRQRIRLLPPDADEVRTGKLYRERRIEPAPERYPSPDDDTAATMARLRERWDELLDKSGQSGSPEEVGLGSPFEALVNHIASRIDIPPRLKQKLLEDDDLRARASRVEAYMGEQLKFWRTLSRYRQLRPEDPSVN